MAARAGVAAPTQPQSLPPTRLIWVTAPIGAEARGIDDGSGPHVTKLVVDHDDPTNPVSAGCLVIATLSRASTSGARKAGGTIVVRADVAYAQRSRNERT